MKERLQKILAKAGIASRRQAEALISQGKIRVNDQIVRELGFKADISCDTIECNGKKVVFEEKVYVLVNKPVGYVTTLSDPQGRPMVSELVQHFSQRLFPVGRLDLNTEGALLMTNDGTLSHAILHPSFEVNKTYEAVVQGFPERQKIALLERGIVLDEGKTRPAKIRILKKQGKQTKVEIIIHEGKKRQVRKMFQAIGHRVLALKRTAYGELRLGDLSSGKCRILKEKDLKKIFSGKIPFTIKNITA